MNKNYFSFGAIALLVVIVMLVFNEPSDHSQDIMSEEQKIIEEQKEENEKLKRENEKLLFLIDELKKSQPIGYVSKDTNNEVETLTHKVGYLQGENEQLRELITKYQETLDQVNQQVLSDSFSVFSKKQLSVGNQIAGLTVSSIQDGTNGEDSFIVNFDGEFITNGFLMINHGGGGSKYIFMVDEDLIKVPHSLNEFERGRLFFDITNDDELEVGFGEVLRNLNPFESIQVEAVFTDYSHVHVPYTDSRSHAEFVRVVSMD
ncbi:hypothetical protein ACERII_05840 [Evansella sp. AB-rgal1]|uniref:hypothetical protein n=1 Tax=Evansella sp. AB-rgal1 TaxID=3242696 RepID=UPI00359F12C5